MSETLTQFGTSFQSKTIASLILDVKFIQTINDILSPEMFDSDSNKWLVKSIRDYFYESLLQYDFDSTITSEEHKIDSVLNSL